MAPTPLGGTVTTVGEFLGLGESPQTIGAGGLPGGNASQSLSTVAPPMMPLRPQGFGPSDGLDSKPPGPSPLGAFLSSEVEMTTPSLRCLFIFAYFSIIIMSVLGNTLVCSVLMKSKRIHSATGVFIANLALAGIMITLLNTPFTLISFFSSTWLFGYMMCYLSRFIQYCSGHVLVLTLVALTLDRYKVILKPDKPRTTALKGSIWVVIIWVLASCFSLPHTLYQRLPQFDTMNQTIRMICLPSIPHPSDVIRKYLEMVNFLFLYILPLLVISLTYSVIGKKLWLQSSIQDATSEYAISRQPKKIMTLKMLIVVVVVFTICWLPLHFYELLLSMHVISSREDVYFAFHWFAMSNACYNPFIYCWVNKGFRNQLKRSVRSWWQRVTSREHELTVSNTSQHPLGEGYPFWNTSMGDSIVNENAFQHGSQTDLSSIHPIVEVT
ncbi:G-protein coupled receptor 83-like [Sminthopsis crassicaudata]|uniref:G-protein coupled receptor 83-like n=1 Tax=Sminthopsis crassicaudata TaxID=9301 RepID=UPI003D69E367